ncbi:DUF3898 domain-containing protein [Cytobacillus horneckiae]
MIHVLLVESESIVFDKGVSPLEFHRPDDLYAIIEKMNRK